ncbi:hypothetical protein ONZ45_g8746 [Pleurotus djamor]|nr:hypothetical protein ONZ45_g8746 [Pleurotus djamor]
MSLFYPRQRLQSRISAFFSAASISGAFSGLLAFGIINMQGVGNRPGWAWIFILEGLFTVVFGVIAFFMMPRSPAHASFLREEEKQYVLRKLQEDSSIGNEHSDRFSWVEVGRAFMLPQVWFLAVAFFFAGTILYSLAYFTPSIVQGLGYTATRAQLMSVPPFATAFVSSTVIAYISDRYRCRGLTTIFCSVLCVIGFAMFLGSTSHSVQYGSLFLSVTGTYCSAPALSTWSANNAAPHVRRATAIAIGFIMTNSGGILATWLLGGSLSPPPKYTKATIILLVFSVGMIVFSAGNLLYLWNENKKKAIFRASRVKSDEAEGLAAICPWKTIELRFTLRNHAAYPLLKGIIHAGVSPLRSLELHEAPFWDEEAAIPSFPCLTSITVRSRISNHKFSLHWLVRLLRNALNVEDVNVKTIQETQDFSVVQAFHSPPVFLAKLKQLTLDFDDPSDSRFFALVTFPEYTAVSVRFSGTRPEVGYFSNLAFLFARLSSVRTNEPVSVEVSGVGIQEVHNYRFSINHSKEKGDPPILHISLIWCITAQPLDENIRIIQAYARDCVSTLSFACLFSPTSAGLMSNLLRIFRFAKKITTTFCHISVLNELVNTLSPTEELVNPFLETLAVSEWALNDEESRGPLLNILRTRSERGKRLPTLMVGRCDFNTTVFEEFTHVDRETLF